MSNILNIDLIHNHSTKDVEYDMDLITNNIWLGNKAAAHNKQLLDKYNIKYIINVTPDIENKFENQGIKYLRVPIHDAELCEVKVNKKNYELLLESFRMINEAIKNKYGVLVHCKKGHHRSANLLLFYYIYMYNTSYIKTLIMINYIRPKSLVRNTCINNWGMEIYKNIIKNKNI